MIGFANRDSTKHRGSCSREWRAGCGSPALGLPGWGELDFITRI